MFASPTKAKLQEIGPKFTLKLRWLRKGLPGVLTADGVAPHAKNADQESEEEEEGDEEDEEKTKEDVEMADAPEQDEAGEVEGESTGKKGKKKEKNVVNGIKIPALDEEQEYEWKWKVCGEFPGMQLNAADLDAQYSRRWMSTDDSSTCKYRTTCCLALCIYYLYVAAQHKWLWQPLHLTLS